MSVLLNSDDIIEAHVSVHCDLIRSAGIEPTDRHASVYRDALKSLVILARNESALGMVRDMQQVEAALRD